MSGFPLRFQKFSVCLSFFARSPCCLQAFSSCGEQGLLLAAVHRLLTAVASLGAEHRLWMHRVQQLWHTGLVALQHVETSWTRDWTHVPCIGRRILIHFTTREVLSHYFFSPSLLLWLHSIHCFSLWCTYFHCFLRSFHSLFVSLIGYFQLIFLLTFWFLFSPFPWSSLMLNLCIEFFSLLIVLCSC